MTKIFKHLKPYIKAAVKENSEVGMPVQRPLFMHYENDQEAYEIKFQYLFGRDILVAPVYNQGEVVKKLYLPEDEWVHVWTGETFTGGWIEIDAPIGQPAVFYRKQSDNAEFISQISKI
ncbi:glycoside hydrolase family 31 protein [Vibrio hannami]|nr:TIM-barrel domain-containing protein [Vibrio hannami]MDG3085961.1 glycoside hydrolase family 31 protein [Vibrio hannami]